MRGSGGTVAPPPPPRGPASRAGDGSPLPLGSLPPLAPPLGPPLGPWVTCRVQYLNDTDPFAYASSFPEPARPPLHCFSTVLPLAEQLAAVHRLLRAPHRVS